MRGVAVAQCSRSGRRGFVLGSAMCLPPCPLEIPRRAGRAAAAGGKWPEVHTCTAADLAAGLHWRGYCCFYPLDACRTQAQLRLRLGKETVRNAGMP
jgi:hypothetical protein